jgi:hypothetical protein
VPRRERIVGAFDRTLSLPRLDPGGIGCLVGSPVWWKSPLTGPFVRCRGDVRNVDRARHGRSYLYRPHLSAHLGRLSSLGTKMPGRPLASWTLWAPTAARGNPPSIPLPGRFKPESPMDTRDFAPEVAEIMKAACERVCRSLGLGEPDLPHPNRRRQNSALCKCRCPRRGRAVPRRAQ